MFYSVSELKQATDTYQWKQNDKVIIWFWEALEELSGEDRVYFIQHWTGTPKLPVEGLKGMEFQISRGRNDKRIFSQTCFNGLRLPDYESKDELVDGLMMAINSVKMGLSILEDH
jgi:E3 ubiquitin-protein ligase NEDD4